LLRHLYKSTKKKLVVVSLASATIVNDAINASHLDALSSLARHDCRRRRVREGTRKPPALGALGFNFSGGDLRPRGHYWYEPEDAYVFEHFFSAGGKPPIKKRGIYLELGALDGRFFSNTLWFEHALAWSGVLVEGSPMVFEELKLNRGGNPNNVLVNAVVCEEGKVVKFAHPSANSNRANIVAANAGAGITGVIPERSHDVFGLRMTTALTCKPLSAILGEAGVRHVDFFSLDCEGAELAVLETLDFDAVKVLVIMIEQKGENPAKDGAVRALMGRHGFRLHSRAGQWCSNEMWLHPEFATAHNDTKAKSSVPGR
jgi:FkbM family methyltransferase